MDERDFPMDRVPVPVEEQCKPYQPPRQEVLQQYEINIQFLSRGCIVRVGCKSIAFENVADALAELNAYYIDPYATQERWREKLG